MTLRADDLVPAGLVAPERLDGVRQVAKRFQVALTDDIVALIDPGDAADPIAAQFVPSAVEFETASEEQADPIGDERRSPVPGIVHRYRDRVLLKPTLVCPVYCRYCFRREQIGARGKVLGRAALERAYSYIRERPEIWEVVVTGGDPFLLAPRRIGELVAAVAAVEHVQVIRFHTRVPIVDPRRVSARLVQALEAEKAVYVVVHANHPRELSDTARAAVARLARAGIPLLSQSVLLRGVNDDAAVLEELFRKLVAMRVKPYYLHHPDLARGTGHFRGDIADGQRLMRELRRRASGLCQPTYVLDIPGGHGKVPVGPCWLKNDAAGWVVEDAGGTAHRYPPRGRGEDTV
ncbi:MAG: lysine-2,3-aminomutase-like protein [Alphaproteobacteria bacterium]|nr:lysine-2,3-aminomutase-like protein [Alphaproteobacteria bacterium]